MTGREIKRLNIGDKIFFVNPCLRTTSAVGIITNKESGNLGHYHFIKFRVSELFDNHKVSDWELDITYTDNFDRIKILDSLDSRRGNHYNITIFDTDKESFLMKWLISLRNDHVNEYNTQKLEWILSDANKIKELCEALLEYKRKDK